MENPELFTILKDIKKYGAVAVMSLFKRLFHAKQANTQPKKAVCVPRPLSVTRASHLPFFSASAGLVITLSFLINSFAYAAPVQDEIISRGIDINHTGSLTTVTQQQPKGIVNWKTFDVGANETVRFDQQAGNHSITLNRVTGGEGASQILGRIEANGSVWLLNADGIYFGAGSVVDVAGILASTYHMSDENFRNGNYQFEADGEHNGRIYNAGEINVSGLAAMLSHDIENVGVIRADLATVMLGSNPTWVLDAYGDDTINFAVSDELLQKEASLKHRGEIYADGGSVYLSVEQAEEVVGSVINVSGLIQASSASVDDGVIVLSAGNGDVYMTGKLEADSGKVHVLGKRIALLEDASIDVSGDDAGEVLIGGDYLGTGDLPHADIVIMDSDAYIYANANDHGDGGKVILWSDEATAFYGNIEAKGGELSGDGGFVETSSKINLSAAGSVDAGSNFGKAGLWLLDPTDVTINATGPTTGAFTGGDPDIWTDAAASASTIDVEAIDAALELADVTILTTSSGSGDGNIIVEDAYTFDEVYSGNTLTLKAENNIHFTGDALSSDLWLFSSDANLVLSAGANGAGDASMSKGVVIFDDQLGALEHIIFDGSSTGDVTIYYNPVDYETPGDFSGVVSDVLMTGSGTYTEYMLINTADDLQSIGDPTTGAGRSDYQDRMEQNYALSQNIDASLASGTILPIGDDASGLSTNRYSGNFDGQNFTISNLTISLPTTAFVGLFGFACASAVIKNIGLVDVSITGKHQVGALVGKLDTGRLVKNAYSTGSVAGVGDDGGGPVPFTNAGGLIGSIFEADVETSFSTASVSGINNVGGLIGFAASAGVTDTYAQGDVTGEKNVGGHTGYAGIGSEGNFSTYTNVYSTGLVTGDFVANSGALIGLQDDSAFLLNYSFSNSESSGQTSLFGTGSEAGGGAGSSLPPLPTAAEMKEEATYPPLTTSPPAAPDGWDFTSIWQINEGNAFPQLFFETLEEPDETTKTVTCGA